MNTEFSMKRIILTNAEHEKEDGLVINFGTDMESEMGSGALGGTLTMIFAEKNLFDSKNRVRSEKRAEVADSVSNFLNESMDWIKASLSEEVTDDDDVELS